MCDTTSFRYLNAGWWKSKSVLIYFHLLPAIASYRYTTRYTGWVKRADGQGSWFFSGQSTGNSYDCWIHLKGLKPYTEYIAKIAITGIRGCGMFSQKEIKFKTKEDSKYLRFFLEASVSIAPCANLAIEELCHKEGQS